MCTRPTVDIAKAIDSRPSYPALSEAKVAVAVLVVPVDVVDGVAKATRSF
jgi:hypothetical protein